MIGGRDQAYALPTARLDQLFVARDLHRRVVGRIEADDRAIGDAQALTSGQLPAVQQVKMTRLYPAYIALPDDFPENLHKVGLAATVYIHTEGAGVVGIVAVVLQWVGTSLDAII